MRALGLVMLSGALLTRNAAAQTIPFWDNFPRIVNFENQMCGAVRAAKAVVLNADVAACSTAADPDTGIWGQRISIEEDSEPYAIDKMHAAGLRTQAYFETFGQAKAFVVEVKKNPDGSWVKDARDPALTKRFLNHWNWERFDGNGEIRWAGAHSYFGDEDFARPYTLTHPRYGSPPVRYPDGSIASGYKGPETDPRNSRVYDACAVKDVNGNLYLDYGYNRAVERRGGPFEGLLEVGSRHAGNFDIGKDAACPSWIDYARASVLHAVDNGVDSMFTDNFSPWDSFGFDPVKKAFGEWSVATFREYLAAHFTKSELAGMGVADAKSFDVRAYLRAMASTFGGSPQDLADSVWKDARWLDDPIWRAYKIHRRQNGTRALAAYYRTVKSASAAAGKPDFAVTGNDFQGFNLGWARGDLDMVNSEVQYTPAAPLASGKYGYMLPPLGSYVPVYKKAREQARGRIGIFWLYVSPELAGHSGIADVLQYQALANHMMPEPFSGVARPRTAGTDATTAAFNAFVGSARSTFGRRTEVEEIGLYYSSSSELSHLTLNGWPAGKNWPGGAPLHSLSFLGWGTALSWLHYQWRAVPEWKLTADTLAGLKLLIVPNAEVFDPAYVPVLKNWVARGGKLIVTGQSGARRGEEGNFELLDKASLDNVGGYYLADDPGVIFANAREERLGLSSRFADALGTIGFRSSVSVLLAPYTVGITIYDDSVALRRFIDLNNTDIDVESDEIHRAPAISLEIKLPAWLESKPIRARVLTPDGSDVRAAIQKKDGNILQCEVSGLLRYASIVLEPDIPKQIGER